MIIAPAIPNAKAPAVNLDLNMAVSFFEIVCGAAVLRHAGVCVNKHSSTAEVP
jgi:hypothetical protein